MPYDLWFRSTARPAAFEPERLPWPALPFAQADRIVSFFAGLASALEMECVAIKVDTQGAIVDVAEAGD